MKRLAETQTKDNSLVAQRVARINQCIQSVNADVFFKPDGDNAVFKTTHLQVAVDAVLVNSLFGDESPEATFENGIPVYTIKILNLSKYLPEDFNVLMEEIARCTKLCQQFEKLTKVKKEYAYGKLKHFTWLVHHYVPEGLNSELEDGYLNFIYSQKQVEEFAQAALYVESHIIPYLQKNGFSQLTPALLQEWIKKIHFYAARTLLTEEPTCVGEYISSGTLVRWVKNIGFHDPFIQAIADQTALQKLFAHYDLGDVYQPFLAVREKVFKTHVPFPPAVYEYLSQQAFPQGHIFLEKLIALFHSGAFSENEKTIIAKIVMVCMPAEQIPVAMHQFATQLVAMLKDCNGQLAEVVRIVEYSFYRLREIHPFANANSRDATLFSNISPIYFNFPVVMYRTPHTENEPGINPDRILLADKIRSQLSKEKPKELSELDQVAEQFKLQMIQFAYQLEDVARLNLFTAEQLDFLYKYGTSRLVIRFKLIESIAAQAQTKPEATIPWQYFKAPVIELSPSEKYEQLKKEALEKFMVEDFPQALTLFGECLKLAQQHNGAQSENVATLYYNIGSCYDRLHNGAQAIDYTRQCFILRQKLLGDAHKDTKKARDKLDALTANLSNKKSAQPQ